MASLNKVILLGHPGADPEARQLANGDAVSKPRLVTTGTWKDNAVDAHRMCQQGSLGGPEFLYLVLNICDLQGLTPQATQ
jgi:hypothetical protein